MAVKRFGVIIAGVLSWATLAHGQTSKPATPGRAAPAPSDPYPLNAAGWGPTAGNGLFVSRWVEDWTGVREAGAAPPFKAIPLGGGASLTMSAEARLRLNAYGDAQPGRGDDEQQGLFRGIVGADLRLHPNVRVYGEIGTGQVESGRGDASANFQNDASLQQLFVDARLRAGSMLVGAMVGRQEFADGPRQLLSISDGPNMHRTWNGVRLYAHGERFRVGAFELRATRQGRGVFDEEIDDAERLYGLNASMVLSPGSNGTDIYLDPFWFHSENSGYRSGGGTGADDRDSYGIRLWGRRGDVRFDWTAVRQTGRSVGRDIDAWGLFALQSLQLSGAGWRARLTLRIDIASGGGTDETGTLRGFNQLYASSGYLGEGRFLSLSNLLLVTPGISVSPTPTLNLSAEYGFASRLNEDDAAYAGGMRAYAGTQNVRGHEIGGLLRIAGNWSVSQNVTVSFGFEHLAAGDVLERAGLGSGSFVFASITFRY